MDSLKSIYWLIAMITVIFIFTAILMFFSFDNWSDRGSFGDMFGSINALFSGLALAGVIYAILLQRKELSLQRQELELTRKELEKSAEAQERSADLLFQQLELSKDSKKRVLEKELLEAEPVFISVGGGAGKDYVDLTIINKGSTITNISIEAISGGYNIEISRKNIFPTDTEAKINISSSLGKDAFYPFKIEYETKLGEKKNQSFDFNHKKGLFKRKK